MLRSRLFPALLPALLLSLLPALTPDAYAKEKDKKEDEDKEDEDDDLLREDDTPSEDAFKEEEEDDGPAPIRMSEGDKAEEEKEGDDLDFGDEGEDENINFNGDEDEQESVKPRQPGEDTAQIYRDAEAKYRELSMEEELLAWERYLQKYPKSLFRDRIEARIEDITQLLYEERVPGSDKGARTQDAADAELNFFQPVHLSSPDTRRHILLEAGWGYPNWTTFQLDYEHTFFREFAIHAGLDTDLTGRAVVVGAKYAAIKSARTGTLLSVGLDLKANTNPGFAGLRPVVSFGQRLRVMDGLDLLGQAAVDMELRSPFGARWEFGFGAELHPNDTVSVFVESNSNIKSVGEDTTFTFMTGVFGLKFVPRKGDKNGDGRFVGGLAADAPYTYHYWGFYRGGVDLLGAYYF